MSIHSKSVGLSPELHKYLVANSCRTHESLLAIQRDTLANPVTAAWARMCSPEDSASLLQMLVKLTGARIGVEIGVFTGFTALAIALALPGASVDAATGAAVPAGRLYALDVSAEYAAVGQPHWAAAGQADKIELRIAPAVESLDALLADDAVAGRVDLVFIDADKEGYDAYYERALKLLRVGGIAVIDNVLRSGGVVRESDTSTATAAIRALNAKIFADARVDVCMVPTSDGVTIARKL